VVLILGSEKAQLCGLSLFWLLWCEWFRLPVLESFALPICVLFVVGVCECDLGSGVFVFERWFVGSFALCCVEVVDGDFAAEDF
jgi:hypothetical protein